MIKYFLIVMALLILFFAFNSARTIYNESYSRFTGSNKTLNELKTDFDILAESIEPINNPFAEEGLDQEGLKKIELTGEANTVIDKDKVFEESDLDFTVIENN